MAHYREELIVRLISAPGWTVSAMACCALLGCSAIKPDFRNLSDKDLTLARQAVLDRANVIHVGDDQLNGIKTVTLGLHYLQNGKKGVSPPESEILKPLTLKLRTAGLKVVPFEERMEAQKSYVLAITKGLPAVKTEAVQDMPLIEQEIQTYKWNNNTIIVSIQTLLFDNAILTRDMTTKRIAVTWRTEGVQTDVVETAKLEAHILKVSTEQIDTFLNAWLKQKSR